MESQGSDNQSGALSATFTTTSQPTFRLSTNSSERSELVPIWCPAVGMNDWLIRGDVPTSLGMNSLLRDSLSHANGDDDAREHRQRADRVDGGGYTERVGERPGEQCAGHVAEVAPKSIHAHGHPAPRWMREIADRRDECRIHERGPETEQHERAGPLCEAADHRHRDERRTLQQHAGDDRSLATYPIAQWTRHELEDSPRRRIDRREHTHLTQPQSRSGEQQGKQSPRETVIQIVDEARLTHAEQRCILPRRASENAHETWPLHVARVASVSRRLEQHVRGRLAREQ